jgi:hypothetical protein
MFGRHSSHEKVTLTQSDELVVPTEATEQPWQDKVNVIVVEARNLAKKNHLTKRANPYCIITYGDDSRMTYYRKKHLHPVWTQSLFTFDYPLQDTLKIEVWSHHKLKRHLFLGEVSIILTGTEKRVINEWFTLQPNAEKHGGDNVSGQIHLMIYNDHPLPTRIPDNVGGVSMYWYREHWDNIKSGDVLLYSGSEWISYSIKTLMHTPYSHVGIAIRMVDPKKKQQSTSSESSSSASSSELSSSSEEQEQQEKELFLIEADWDDQDYLINEEVYGIIVNRFEERMHNYEGDVIWHCPLKQPLSEEEEDTLAAYLMDLKAKKVKFDMKQGLKLMAHIKNKEDGKAMFCSELVSAALKVVERVPPTVNSSNMSPFQVAKLDCIQGVMPVNILRYQVVVRPSMRDKIRQRVKHSKERLMEHIDRSKGKEATTDA